MLQPRGTVVFLGAGASKAFGLPLTNEILPQIVARLGGRGGPPLFRGPRQADLAMEFRAALRALYPGLDLDAAGNELPNITNVLSFIDHLILYDYPAALGFGKERLVQARRLLERGIMEVLLDGDLSPILDQLQDQQDYSPNVRELPLAVERRMTTAERTTLQSFLDWLRKEGAGEPLTVVTTNYDVAVETPLFTSIGVDRVAEAIDFGFDWRDPYREVLVPRPAQPQLAILKLHGSLNWLRCDLCGQVYINPLEVIAYLSFNEHQSWPNTCECGAWPLRHLIVAPSMVRDVRDPHLLNVWRSATEALRTAKRWFLIGYSLPAEDLAIRSMLLRAHGARGLQAGPMPLAARPHMPSPRVTVVQRGESARGAYASLFREFDYIAGGVEALVGRANG